MKTAIRYTMFIILLLAPSASFWAQAPVAQEVASTAIPNYLELSTRIGTGGQPTEEGMKFLSDKGYKSVLNLRSSSEPFEIAAEERQALQLGLRYYMIPFVPKEPSEQQALAFNALMSALKNDKVFVHCASGNRVGSLMMIYLALEEGMAPDKAEQEARRIGLRAPDLIEFARRVISSQKK